MELIALAFIGGSTVSGSVVYWVVTRQYRQQIAQAMKEIENEYRQYFSEATG